MNYTLFDKYIPKLTREIRVYKRPHTTKQLRASSQTNKQKMLGDIFDKLVVSPVSHKNEFKFLSEKKVKRPTRN